jgi:hypothetical protein
LKSRIFEQSTFNRRVADRFRRKLSTLLPVGELKRQLEAGEDVKGKGVWNSESLNTELERNKTGDRERPLETKFG